MKTTKVCGAAAAAALLILSVGACERHSYEVTKELIHEPGAHHQDDHHAPHGAADHGEPPKPGYIGTAPVSESATSAVTPAARPQFFPPANE